jgi:hypothetical protein
VLHNASSVRVDGERNTDTGDIGAGEEQPASWYKTRYNELTIKAKGSPFGYREMENVGCLDGVVENHCFSGLVVLMSSGVRIQSLAVVDQSPPLLDPPR